MILTEFISIKVNHNSIKHYQNLGYVVSCSSIIDIPINHLSNGSKYIIDCICDYCSNKTKIPYRDYLSNIKNQNRYACKSCKFIKSKKTNVEKYGYESPLKNEHIKNKLISTNQLRYGGNSPMSSEKIREKSKVTLLESYGVESPLKSDLIKERQVNTNMLVYGFNVPSKSEEVKNKMKSTNILKYGVDNPGKSIEVINKIKSTNILKYGMSSVLQSTFIKNLGMLKKYGVKNAQQDIDIFLKTQKNSFKTGVYENISYQGTYELDFLLTCEKIEILSMISKPIGIRYGGCDRIYYPDFYLPHLNLIVEIKSSYYYNLYKEKNIAKMNKCKMDGYDFIFIINKDYIEFINKVINK